MNAIARLRRHLARIRVANGIRGLAHFPTGNEMTQPRGGFVIWVELPRGSIAWPCSKSRYGKASTLSGAPVLRTGRYRNFSALNCGRHDGGTRSGSRAAWTLSGADGPLEPGLPRANSSGAAVPRHTVQPIEFLFGDDKYRHRCVLGAPLDPIHGVRGRQPAMRQPSSRLGRTDPQFAARRAVYWRASQRAASLLDPQRGQRASNIATRVLDTSRRANHRDDAQQRDPRSKSSSLNDASSSHTENCASEHDESRPGNCAEAVRNAWRESQTPHSTHDRSTPTAPRRHRIVGR